MDLCQTSPGSHYKRNFTQQNPVSKPSVKKHDINSVKKQPEKTSLKIDYCDRYENIGARPEIIRKKG